MEEKSSIMPIGIKYGVLSAVISIVYTLLLYVTNLFLNSSLGFLSVVITVLLLVFACREYKTNNEGFMALGTGFKLNMLVMVLSSIPSALFNYIYTKYIDTTISETTKNFQRAQFEKQGMSDEQIEQAMSMAASFTSPEFILMAGLGGGLFMGAIIAIVVAFAMKKVPDTV